MPHRVTANHAPRRAAGWLLLCATFSAWSAAYAGLAMPEAITSYRMRVRYDPVRHEAQGQATISWINNSGETVPDLQLHLYLNAFLNVKSTYFRESEDADLLRAAHGLGGLDVGLAHLAGVAVEQVEGADHRTAQSHGQRVNRVEAGR